MIAATNADLKEEIKASRFREDLYYRVNVVSFVMPPLRDRKEDIPLLSAAFLERFASREGKDLHGIDEDAMEMLVGYDWPGNVRQLENKIERGVVVSMGDRLSRKALPPRLLEYERSGKAGTRVLEGDCLLADVEKVAVDATLRRYGGNKSRAARTLGISRKLLYSKIRECGL